MSFTGGSTVYKLLHFMCQIPLISVNIQFNLHDVKVSIHQDAVVLRKCVVKSEMVRDTVTTISVPLAPLTRWVWLVAG